METKFTCHPYPATRSDSDTVQYGSTPGISTTNITGPFISGRLSQLLCNFSVASLFFYVVRFSTDFRWVLHIFCTFLYVFCTFSCVHMIFFFLYFFVYFLYIFCESLCRHADKFMRMDPSANKTRLTSVLLFIGTGAGGYFFLKAETKHTSAVISFFFSQLIFASLVWYLIVIL